MVKRNEMMALRGLQGERESTAFDAIQESALHHWSRKSELSCLKAAKTRARIISDVPKTIATPVKLHAMSRSHIRFRKVFKRSSQGAHSQQQQQRQVHDLVKIVQALPVVAPS